VLSLVHARCGVNKCLPCSTCRDRRTDKSFETLRRPSPHQMSPETLRRYLKRRMGSRPSLSLLLGTCRRWATLPTPRRVTAGGEGCVCGILVGRKTEAHPKTTRKSAQVSREAAVQWLRTSSRISAAQTASELSSCASCLCSPLLRRNTSKSSRNSLELGSTLAKVEKRGGRGTDGVVSTGERSWTRPEGAQGSNTRQDPGRASFACLSRRGASSASAWLGDEREREGGDGLVAFGLVLYPHNHCSNGNCQTS